MVKRSYAVASSFAAVGVCALLYAEVTGTPLLLRLQQTWTAELRRIALHASSGSSQRAGAEPEGLTASVDPGATTAAAGQAEAAESLGDAAPARSMEADEAKVVEVTSEKAAGAGKSFSKSAKPQSEPAASSEGTVAAVSQNRSVSLPRLGDVQFSEALVAAHAKGYPRVLKFIHVPKTGGTAIEDEAERVAKLFPELRAATRWGNRDDTFQCQKRTGRDGRMCSLPTTSGHGPCYHWHAPPFRDDTVAAYYDSPEHRSFCVVRHPYDRIFSQWHFYNMFYISKWNCTEDEYSRWANKTMDKLERVETLQDCHWIPQVEYVFDKRGKQVCHHVLRYEDLGEQFATLVKAYNLSMSLKRHSMDPGKAAKSCHLKLREDVRKRAHDFFKDDFDVFGYAP